MRSERTAKELAAVLAEQSHHEVEEPPESFIEEAEAVAAFLGVELAPEKLELPGWAEESLRLERRSGDTLSVEAESQWVSSIAAANGSPNAELLAALVETHRRWLAAKRELEESAAHVNNPLPEIRVLREAATGALRILRGEDRE